MFTNEREFAAWVTKETGEEYAPLDEIVSDVYSVAFYVADPDADDNQVDGMTKYYFEGPFGAEYLYYHVYPAPSGKYYILSIDFTKSQSDDWGHAIYNRDGIGSVFDFYREGSPIRKTNKAGPGTKDTRKYEGFGDTPHFLVFGR